MLSCFVSRCSLFTMLNLRYQMACQHLDDILRCGNGLLTVVKKNDLVTPKFVVIIKIVHRVYLSQVMCIFTTAHVV